MAFGICQLSLINPETLLFRAISWLSLVQSRPSGPSCPATTPSTAVILILQSCPSRHALITLLLYRLRVCMLG